MVYKDRHEHGSVAQGFGDLLRGIRKHAGGRWTVNQCVVMHNVFLAHLTGEECTVRSIHRQEGMAQQTISNAVAALRAAGMVAEEVHPEDGRLRLIVPSKQALDLRNRWWAEAVGIVIPQ